MQSLSSRLFIVDVKTSFHIDLRVCDGADGEAIETVVFAPVVFATAEAEEARVVGEAGIERTGPVEAVIAVFVAVPIVAAARGWK